MHKRPFTHTQLGKQPLSHVSLFSGQVCERHLMKDNSNVVIFLTFPVKWQVVFAIQSKNLLGVSNFFCNKPSKQVSAKHVNKHTLPKSYAYQVSESTPTLVIVDVGLSPFCYMLPFMLLHYMCPFDWD